MKNLYYLVLLLFVVSCGEKTSNETNENLQDQENVAAEPEAPTEEKVVLLWDASISDGTTKDKKWVASYQFGNTLILTGKTEENADDKRTYVEVTGPDGKTGWINQSILATQSTVGVATEDIPLYKNPDVMSVSANSVKAGDILAVSTENKNGFRQVYGKEKVIKGFINSIDAITSDPIDLKVAVFYSKAMASKTEEEKIKALQGILNDASNSSSTFYPLVQQKLYELMPQEETTTEPTEEGGE